MVRYYQNLLLLGVFLEAVYLIVCYNSGLPSFLSFWLVLFGALLIRSRDIIKLMGLAVLAIIDLVIYGMVIQHLSFDENFTLERKKIISIIVFFVILMKTLKIWPVIKIIEKICESD